jgi:hypothetical protein
MYHHQIVNFKLGGVMVLIRIAPVDQAGFTLCLSFPPQKKRNHELSQASSGGCSARHLAAFDHTVLSLSMAEAAMAGLH